VAVIACRGCSETFVCENPGGGDPPVVPIGVLSMGTRAVSTVPRPDRPRRIDKAYCIPLRRPDPPAHRFLARSCGFQTAGVRPATRQPTFLGTVCGGPEAAPPRGCRPCGPKGTRRRRPARSRVWRLPRGQSGSCSTSGKSAATRLQASHGRNWPSSNSARGSRNGARPTHRAFWRRLDCEKPALGLRIETGGITLWRVRHRLGPAGEPAGDLTETDGHTPDQDCKARVAIALC